MSAPKKALAQQAKAARAEYWRPHKEEKKRERRCFWTWPLGHRYGLDGRCVLCDRNRYAYVGF